MRRTLALAVFFTAALVITAAGASAGDGKTIFEREHCGICHSVAAAGIQAKLAEGKGGGGELGGAVTPAKVDWTMRFLEGEEKKDGKSHNKPFKGTDEELQALVDWLGEQKSE